MIERYIFAVTKELPEDIRQETTTDLRKRISSQLKKKSSQLSEDEKIREVLLELGPPKILANRYRGKERYLIGPRYFERYLYVLKIVALSIFIGLTVVHGFSVLFSVESLIEVLGGYIGTLFAALLQGVALVTGIFALLEYNDVTLSEKTKNKAWDPSQLPAIPKKKAIISRGESVVTILFLTLVLTLLFFSPEAVGIYYTIGETMKFIPLFNLPALPLFRSLIFVSFIIEIMIEVVKILKGRWTRNLAVLVTVLNVLSMGLIIYALINTNIWNEELISKINSLSLNSFNELLNFILLGMLVVTITESATALYKGFKYGEGH